MAGSAAAQPVAARVRVVVVSRACWVAWSRQVKEKPIALCSRAFFEEWELPRAFDCTDVHDHYGGLYSHLSAADFRAALTRIAKGLDHEAIPANIRDNLRRVATSSLPVGAKTRAWKKVGPAFAFCARACCGPGPRVEESLEHLVHE